MYPAWCMCLGYLIKRGPIKFWSIRPRKCFRFDCNSLCSSFPMKVDWVRTILWAGRFFCVNIRSLFSYVCPWLWISAFWWPNPIRTSVRRIFLEWRRWWLISSIRCEILEIVWLSCDNWIWLNLQLIGQSCDQYNPHGLYWRMALRILTKYI